MGRKKWLYGTSVPEDTPCPNAMDKAQIVALQQRENSRLIFYPQNVPTEHEEDYEKSLASSEANSPRYKPHPASAPSPKRRKLEMYLIWRGAGG